MIVYDKHWVNMSNFDTISQRACQKRTYLSLYKTATINANNTWIASFLESIFLNAIFYYRSDMKLIGISLAIFFLAFQIQAIPLTVFKQECSGRACEYKAVDITGDDLSFAMSRNSKFLSINYMLYLKYNTCRFDILIRCWDLDFHRILF